MKRLFLILLIPFFLTGALSAQSKLVKDLEKQRNELQKQIASTESLLKSTKKNVGSQLNALTTLNGQISERKRYIATINKDINTIDRELNKLNRQLTELKKDLSGIKKNYEASVQYLYKNRTIEEKLMFLFSAENLSQTYRRLRYVQEYATYQRLQGEEILKKQKEVENKAWELRLTRKAKTSLLTEREKEKSKLENQQKQQRTLVSNLQKKQKDLQSEINKKRREADRLNAQIDRLVAAEIDKTTKTSSGKPKAMSKEDLNLASDFASNKGKLPMPVTGSSVIISRYGVYGVQGLKNVKLDNKGIDIQAQPGAQARSIFNGKVAAIFKTDNDLFNILIRHGNYISVYCNLSSTSVKPNQTVKTGQSIGRIYSDSKDSNRTVLHFQLRKERQKLNPEMWLRN